MCDAGIVNNAEKRIAMRPLHYRRISEISITMMVGWIGIGTMLVAAGFTTWSPSIVLRVMPNWFEMVLGLTIGGGSALALWGLFSPGPKLESNRWAYEITGLIISGVGWTVFTLASLLLDPAVSLLWWAGGMFAVGSIWRASRVGAWARHTRSMKKLIDEEDE